MVKTGNLNVLSVNAAKVAKADLKRKGPKIDVCTQPLVSDEPAAEPVVSAAKPAAAAVTAPCVPLIPCVPAAGG